MARYSLPKCQCGSGLAAPQRLDARGIFITYACDKCWREKAKGYRTEVLEDPNYLAEEPIEPEDY
jgi:hypothetical protein